MCDDRERLIDFLYGEGVSDDREVVRAHVEECAACRSELAALRSVRQDLLGWAVPETPPLWRPVETQRPAPTWRDVPAWALAAAAAVTLLAGGGGAVASRLLLPVPPTASATTAAVDSTEPSGGPAVTATPITADDLTRFEAELMRKIDAEMTQRIQVMASHQPARPQVVSAPDAKLLAEVRDLQLQLNVIQERQMKQIALNVDFNNRMNRMTTVANTPRTDNSLIPVRFAR